MIPRLNFDTNLPSYRVFADDLDFQFLLVDIFSYNMFRFWLYFIFLWVIIYKQNWFC